MEPEAVLSSPLVRALQTAEILAAELPFPGEVLPSSLLAAGPPPDRLAELLAPLRRCRSVALVGHDPWLSALCRSLLPLGADFSLRKGDIVAAELDPEGELPSATLRWHVTKGRLVRPSR
jgi:phosphohistidine phosphatase